MLFFFSLYRLNEHEHAAEIESTKTKKKHSLTRAWERERKRVKKTQKSITSFEADEREREWACEWVAVAIEKVCTLRFFSSPFISRSPRPITFYYARDQFYSP